MSKKVIRLTEADIEKIVRQVIEEQKDRDKNDVKRNKRRKKLADEETGPSDWGGKVQGTLDFDTVTNNDIFLAVNVGRVGYKIARHNDGGKLLQPTQRDNDVTLEEFNIAGSSLPYADNMVKPYFDKYPDAQTVFNDIVRKFVRYIEAGGGPKLTNVTIKGSADSARPTLDVPSGYSQLDHPDSKPYNGETDPFKMNQYLADKRAEEYANALKSIIKEQTNFDLTITVLPGDNYYGQQGKRGEEYRKITLSPNAETLTVPNPSQTTTTTTTQDNENKPSAIPYYVEYYQNGKLYDVPGYNVVNDKGHSFAAIPREKADAWGTPTFTGNKLSSEIKDGKFYIDGKLVGTIEHKVDAPRQFTTYGDVYTYWVGPITNIRTFRNAQIEGGGIVNTALVNDSYFLLYE